MLRTAKNWCIFNYCIYFERANFDIFSVSVYFSRSTQCLVIILVYIWYMTFSESIIQQNKYVFLYILFPKKANCKLSTEKVNNKKLFSIFCYFTDHSLKSLRLEISWRDKDRYLSYIYTLITSIMLRINNQNNFKGVIPIW